MPSKETEKDIKELQINQALLRESSARTDLMVDKMQKTIEILTDSRVRHDWYFRVALGLMGINTVGFDNLGAVLKLITG